MGRLRGRGGSVTKVPRAAGWPTVAHTDAALRRSPQMHVQSPAALCPSVPSSVLGRTGSRATALVLPL